jgi:hypothetical protein
VRGAFDFIFCAVLHRCFSFRCDRLSVTLTTMRATMRGGDIGRSFSG